jgi:hypothetical protein
MKAAKAVVAAVGLVVTALVAALGDDVIDANEWGSIGGAVVAGIATVTAVYAVKNKPAQPLPPPPPPQP